MADVWKIGQDMKADEFYKRSPLFNGCHWGGNDVMKANNLAKICNEMSNTYDQIIEDQNSYIVDIDASLDEISTLETNLEEKIKQLEKEISELLEKKDKGTITEEEEAELSSKITELDNLKAQGNTEIAQKKGEVVKTTDSAQETERKSKAEIATDYGETALEKGQPLSETKDKRKSFWRKAFGGWNKQAERDAGNKLLEAGNGLLEQVSISSNLDKEIEKKTKGSV